ncbi:MAG: metal-binding protein [Chloroherpetonaceae bacterium]|nr:metal-binding protein [Chthonomonadaceae bacterium]MDW8208889.1 metal-binding protein [Chloroherpetonaceae bacterium]
MPNARTHDTVNLITAAAANVAYFTLAPRPDVTLAALFTGSYLFAGYACAGDLDLDSREYRRWGRLRFLWWPYQKLIPHRSRLSHGLLLGGVVRACYLMVLCTLILWVTLWALSLLEPRVDPGAITRQQWASALSFFRSRPEHTTALLSGFILAGTTHSLTDMIATWFKRRF